MIKPVKIVIWGDHQGQQEYLRSLLRGYPGFEVIGVFNQLHLAAQMAKQVKPDLGVVQIAHQCYPGYDLTRQWIDLCPSMKVIWTANVCEEEQLLGALRSGAKGYMLADDPPHKLPEAVTDILNGGIALSPRVAVHLVNHLFGLFEPVSYQFTDRERNILKNLVDGMPIKIIAPLVFLSEDGVKKNLHNIYTKLGVSNGKEAVAKAIRERIV